MICHSKTNCVDRGGFRHRLQPRAAHFEGWQIIDNNKEQNGFILARQLDDVRQFNWQYMTGRENFRVDVFSAILDRLMTELQRRYTAYKQFHDRFKIFSDVTQLSTPDVSKLVKKLREHYSDDLGEWLEEECQNLRSHLISCGSDKQSMTSLPMCESRHGTDLLHLFPNVDIGLCMSLCTPATNW